MLLRPDPGHQKEGPMPLYHSSLILSKLVEPWQQFSIWKRHRRAVACSGSRVALLSTSRLKGGAWEANSTLQQAPGWQSHREFTKNQGQLHGKSRLQALHRLWFDGNLLVRAMFSTKCCDASAILRTAGAMVVYPFRILLKNSSSGGSPQVPRRTPGPEKQKRASGPTA